MEPDGRNIRALTDPTLLDTRRADWSPDGSRIIFWAMDLRLEVGQPRYAVFSVSVVDGTTIRLTSYIRRSGWLAVAPDNSRIVFSDDARLYSVLPEGGEIHALDMPLNSYLITWSPDGKYLAGAALDNDQSSIYIFDPENNNVHFLITDLQMVKSINWSPDSSELIFLSGDQWVSASHAGIVNIESGEIREYATEQGILEPLKAITHVIWSPDGEHIVISGRYQSGNPYNTETRLYMINREFTEMQPITDFGHKEDVVQWRP